MSKPKSIKCWHCKKAIKDLNNIVKIQVGRKELREELAHYECRKVFLERKEFYEWLKKKLDMPIASPYLRSSIEELNKNYSWEVIKRTIDKNIDDINNGMIKGIPYIVAILKNNCHKYHLEIEKEKEFLYQSAEDIYISNINKLQLKRKEEEYIDQTIGWDD